MGVFFFFFFFFFFFLGTNNWARRESSAMFSFSKAMFFVSVLTNQPMSNFNLKKKYLCTPNEKKC
jgi:hypothetical protein